MRDDRGYPGAAGLSDSTAAGGHGEPHAGRFLRKNLQRFAVLMASLDLQYHFACAVGGAAGVFAPQRLGADDMRGY